RPVSSRPHSPAAECPCTPVLRAAAGKAAENLADEIIRRERIAAARTTRGRPAISARTRTRSALARAKPFEAAGKALELRLAVGADFAAVELGALVLVADDLIG